MSVVWESEVLVAMVMYGYIETEDVKPKEWCVLEEGACLMVLTCPGQFPYQGKIACQQEVDPSMPGL